MNVFRGFVFRKAPFRAAKRLAKWLCAFLLIAHTGSVSAKVMEPEAQPTPMKPVWKWTVGERLAARFDPAALADREAGDKARQEAIRQRWGLLADEEAKMTGPRAATENLDGSKTPELFLPFELFTELVRRGLPLEERQDIQGSRGGIQQRAAALGFGRDLWDRLERTAEPYLMLLHHVDRQTLITRSNDFGEKHGLRLCRLRAQAVEAAKAEFGEEAFLRLLYEAVAPDFRTTSGYLEWPPDYQRREEQLRFIEGGCR